MVQTGEYRPDTQTDGHTLPSSISPFGTATRSDAGLELTDFPLF